MKECHYVPIKINNYIMAVLCSKVDFDYRNCKYFSYKNLGSLISGILVYSTDFEL